MSQYDEDGATIDNETGEEISRELMTVAPSGVVAAEISQQVATARAYPRRRDREIVNEIMGRAILNEAVAKECVYSVKRGGKMNIGPSIRFFEIVAASYGNMRVATRFVRIDQDDPELCAVIVEAIAIDCETNNSVTKQIRRSIMTSDHDKDGRRIKPRRYNADMTNITVNAAQSIAHRNAVKALVPQALWNAGYQRAVAVTRGTQETLGQRRKVLVEEFIALGATAQQVFAALEVRDLSEIQIDHMPLLVGMLNAINDGESIAAVLDRFGPAETPAHEKVENPLRDKPANVKPANPDDHSRHPEAGHGDLSTADNGVGEDHDRAVQAREEPPARGRRVEPGPDLKNHTDERLPPADLGGRKDPISSGPFPKYDSRHLREAAGEGTDRPTHTAAEAAERSQGAAVGGRNGSKAPPYDDEPSYLAFMRWHFANTKVPTTLKDAWASTRADRRELLSVKANEDITTEYNAAQTALI